MEREEALCGRNVCREMMEFEEAGVETEEASLPGIISEVMELSSQMSTPGIRRAAVQLHAAAASLEEMAADREVAVDAGPGCPEVHPEDAARFNHRFTTLMIRAPVSVSVSMSVSVCSMILDTQDTAFKQSAFFPTKSMIEIMICYT